MSELEKKQKNPQTKFKLWGHEMLSKPTEIVSKAYITSPEFKETVKRLLQASDLNRCVGLSANQIGVHKRFALIRLKPAVTRPDIKELPPEVIINPEVIERSNKLGYGWEGCFSNEGIFFFVPRSIWIKVKYMNEKGEIIIRKVESIEAKVFEHEIDHLDGIICGERVMVRNNQVVRGAIITDQEYKRDPFQIPVGAKDIVKPEDLGIS